MSDLYGGLDPRNIDTYTIGDAARYLRMPKATIRSWTVGRTYPTSEGSRYFQPLIDFPDQKPRLLSFTNLVEIHVLRAIRQTHHIQLDKVRTALDYIEAQLNVSHPLAHEEFRTDGVDLFIQRYGNLINVSRDGQILLKNALAKHLKRIEVDEAGLAVRLYPFTRSREDGSPRLVVIDPGISFGRLVIAGTGIPTHIVAERYQAGDSIDDLVRDYKCNHSKIEEAIRCELLLVA